MAADAADAVNAAAARMASAAAEETMATKAATARRRRNPARPARPARPAWPTCPVWRRLLGAALLAAMALSALAPAAPAAAAPVGAGGVPARMTVGVHADAAASTHAAEGAAQPETFTVRGEGLANVGAVNVRLSVKSGSRVEWELGGALAGAARVKAVEEGVPGAAEGYRTVSVYVLAGAGDGDGGVPFTLADGEALLVLKVTPADAVSQAVTVLLSHADVAYYDAAVGGGAGGVDADVTVRPSVATTAQSYKSRFDVNGDGAVTLADVNQVRQYLGTASADAAWAAAATSDVAANGVIDLADLTLIIAAYEAQSQFADFPDEYPEAALESIGAAEVGAKVDALLRAMTREEMASLLVASPSSQNQKRYGTGYINGVPRLGVPVLRMWDGPMGVISNSDLETTSPASELALASSFSESLAYKYGQLTGSDNRASARSTCA
jgi:hypothetical protein